MLHLSAVVVSVYESEYFWAAIGLLNCTYAARSRLTPWRLRNTLLNECYDVLCDRVEDVLTKCKILTLVSDGWSSVQKKHVLNILLCTPIPFFIRDIYTSYQRNLRAKRQVVQCQEVR